MLKSDDALFTEIRLTGSPGKERRRTYYVFQCCCDGCTLTFRATKSEINKRSGFCKQHAKVHTAKRQSNTRPFWGHYQNLRYNAAKYHIDKVFDITYEQFVFLTQIGICHYCGEPNIVWDANSSNRKSNLDRKDNTKGYTFDNVVVCCKDCNLMKRDWFSYDEFKAMRLLLKRWREGTQEKKEELMYMLSSWNSDIRILL
jgi:hypothetical protein